MNETISTILKRQSLRRYDERDISKEDLDLILKSAMRAPTAGNMMCYSIIIVKNNETKEKLSVSCDNQPFIKTAPVLLVFLADYSKWYKYYESNNTKDFMAEKGENFEGPTEASLMLATQDALIAAENAVIAAESLGIGSCYIGDIMENYEYHKELLNLPKYVYPVTMITLGYHPEGYNIPLKERFDDEYVIFEEKYKELDEDDIKEMFKDRDQLFVSKNKYNANNYAQYHYNMKVKSDFSKEMTRSVKLSLEEWNGGKI
ncbi:nitroreductase [Clostridium tertium]|uniref:FMN reductase [NAD(P)H] n=1 Tax=Clostridium tertium TaxID=1559 RepID=A0A6N2YKN1_9CLOT